jgi:hypothetical protein
MRQELQKDDDDNQEHHKHYERHFVKEKDKVPDMQ